ncbi:hypothetical protein Z517_04724 [Fonsecaea pedrosoi CBS 271.37]|uniref:Aminoglycoside phosphotransferase domain-containing protein n=1 Tax=Fonsecaea pedrosoi CBS 271.37 TaxID=1442368 RepID=A0A0D2GL85_9EURO|nr:uncharacterized protein Z517_04724 [Fonsecaea pedrosoi CBS 271.37]KIW81698.1 hypothetical protein Z517_04724 [Fonsecaea pedrosoi CBS 271.37]
MEGCPFSQAEIIKRCSTAAFPEEHIGGAPYGNRVLQLSATVAVKYGVGLTQDEAANQQRAYDLLDREIVRVPKVFTFFQDDSDRRGYLVMEFMEGILSAILDHFASIKSSNPGSLGGGPLTALLFGESEPPTFRTIQELEAWLNEILLDPGSRVTLADSDLVLCHLDLFLRNILWAQGQPPCVLDWATAGFFPRMFERCSHLIKPEPASWQVVLNVQISPDEDYQCGLIMKAWRNDQRFSFSKTNYYKDLYGAGIRGSAPVTLPPLPPLPTNWLKEYLSESAQN